MPNQHDVYYLLYFDYTSHWPWYSRYPHHHHSTVLHFSFLRESVGKTRRPTPSVTISIVSPSSPGLPVPNAPAKTLDPLLPPVIPLLSPSRASFLFPASLGRFATLTTCPSRTRSLCPRLRRFVLVPTTCERERRECEVVEERRK